LGPLKKQCAIGGEVQGLFEWEKEQEVTRETSGKKPEKD